MPRDQINLIGRRTVDLPCVAMLLPVKLRCVSTLIWSFALSRNNLQCEECDERKGRPCRLENGSSVNMRHDIDLVVVGDHAGLEVTEQLSELASKAQAWLKRPL